MTAGPDEVRRQYEDLPYPPRDPADERKRLITGSPSHLAEIVHYGFAGVMPAPPFRALIAGGGTGDGLIMLAQHLAAASIDAEVTYLDLSEASRAVAEQRAGMRGLRNIRFVTGSLLDLDRLAPGPYRYIDCCGVLHHLLDPAAGLARLAANLAPDGAMGLMLYGELGRTGVYPIQRALKVLAPERASSERVALARRLLKDLPESNWLRRNPFVGDHLQGSDAALYDLLLHSQDRAYLVPEILDLLQAAGLALAAFVEPAKYAPETWLADAELRARAAALPEAQRWTLAENLAGAMKTHVFYAVPAARGGRSVARPDSAEMVPLWREIDGAALGASLLRNGSVTVRFDGHPLVCRLDPAAARLAGRIDGRHSLAALQRQGGEDWLTFKASFDRLYAALNPLNLLLLRRG